MPKRRRAAPRSGPARRSAMGRRCDSPRRGSASGPVAPPQVRQAPGRGHHRRAGRAAAEQERGNDDPDVEAAASIAADPDRQRSLAGPAVGLDVADVVDDEDRGREQADRDREQDRQAVELLELHVVGAVDGDQAEEDEDEDLAETLVSVGPRAAGVEDTGQDRDDADREDLGADLDRQVGAAGDRDREGEPGRDQDAARRGKALRGDPYRPEAIDGVGAALGVGVVVGQVGADLDPDRTERAQRSRSPSGRRRPGGPPPRCRPAPARSRRAASGPAPPGARSSTARASRPLRVLLEVRLAALLVGVAAFLAFLAHVEEQGRVVGELLDPGQPVLDRR